jgi:hypothetical protein
LRPSPRPRRSRRPSTSAAASAPSAPATMASYVQFKAGPRLGDARDRPWDARRGLRPRAWVWRRRRSV